MTARAALKLVERPSFFREEGELWADASGRDAHSLHYALSHPGQTPPELSQFAIQRFSRRGDVILDPFMGSGGSVLEALLAGRTAYGSDLNPLYVQAARAKIQPADITEVTLRLQIVNLRRPVAIEDYRRGFSSFYDIDTFREIVGLRSYLQEHDDKVSRFIKMLAIGLLHGHSAGYFSVYSLPQLSVAVDEQEHINRKRAQAPDYRAVVPRLLRRAAMLLRDGVPSVLTQNERHTRLSVKDARDLSFVPSGHVSLVVTSPPLPGDRRASVDQWLRLWFAGIGGELLAPAEAFSASAAMTDAEASPLREQYQRQKCQEWRVFMNECLLEMARTVRPSGRAVLAFSDNNLSRATGWSPDSEVLDLIERELSRYWDAECLLVHQPKVARVQHQVRAQGVGQAHRLLVLRRK